MFACAEQPNAALSCIACTPVKTPVLLTVTVWDHTSIKPVIPTQRVLHGVTNTPQTVGSQGNLYVGRLAHCFQLICSLFGCIHTMHRYANASLILFFKESAEIVGLVHGQVSIHVVGSTPTFAAFCTLLESRGVFVHAKCLNITTPSHSIWWQHQQHG